MANADAILDAFDRPEYSSAAIPMSALLDAVAVTVGLVPPPGQTPLAPRTSTPQPALEHDLGAYGTHRRSVAAETPRAAPLPRAAIRRSTPPTQETSAVVPLAGICAGGRP